MTEATRSYRMDARAAGVERTRERVLAVAREHFIHKPYDDVRLADVAGGAGVTQQTLLNHFSSKEGLLLALVDVLQPEVEALRGPAVPAEPAAAVKALLRQYEPLGNANWRMQETAPRVPAVALLVERGRSSHLAWLEGVFGPRLPDRQPGRRRCLAALFVATDVGTWKLLRRDLGHSRTDTTAVMTDLVRSALAARPSTTTTT